VTGVQAKDAGNPHPAIFWNRRRPFSRGLQPENTVLFRQAS